MFYSRVVRVRAAGKEETGSLMIFFAENERASELLRALSMMRFLREVVREESARAFVAAFFLSFQKLEDARTFFV